tara:strand:+ start:537 stop:905 length:369 start_codon:yes stop_codon:yes gene_type:complete
MATLTAKLTLTSSNATSDALNLSVTDTLTTTEPSIPVARTSVTTTGANNIIQPATDGQTYYVYVKHTGNSGTLNVELTGDVVIGKLAAGEFMFMPVGGHALGVQLQSSASTIIAEYAYFTKG